MLVPGSIDMSRQERIAVDTLLVELGEPKASISRAEAGEGGPLLIKVYEGKTYAVDASGKTSEVTDG